jgi:hypothetical protein
LGDKEVVGVFDSFSRAASAVVRYSTHEAKILRYSFSGDVQHSRGYGLVMRKRLHACDFSLCTHCHCSGTVVYLKNIQRRTYRWLLLYAMRVAIAGRHVFAVLWTSMR